MNNRVSILSTALLPKSLTDYWAGEGMELDVLPFIETVPVKDKELEEEVAEFCLLPVTAVFTSANAVRAISETIKHTQPEWNVYCIGNTTKNAVLECFDNVLISGVAGDAAALAEIILDHDVLEVVFFCGDKRMDTLPDLLEQDGVTVYQLTVYQTLETPQVATKGYDGIMFFSPSAVNSFFSVNTIGPHSVLFAIGNTTADAVKQKSGNQVITSETPSKEQVVEDVLQYFNKQAHG